MTTRQTLFTLLLTVSLACGTTAQPGQPHTSDHDSRASSRVNASTLAMEFTIPLASYPGRGFDIPVAMSYSSRVWSLARKPSLDDSGACVRLNETIYGDGSAAGWTSSLAIPYIEYVGTGNIFDASGAPAGCRNRDPAATYNAWVRRVIIHLPNGSAHELRMDDRVLWYPLSSDCDPDPSSPCDASDPNRPELSDGWYYAVDGSNIRYFEDRANAIHYAQLPDGRRFDFSTSLGESRSANIRFATRMSDVHGNSATFRAPSDEFPNGSIVDTIGRVIAIPFGERPPSQPEIQTVVLPGFNGSEFRYRFHWKRLKGDSPNDSALNDFEAELKFAGDAYVSGGRPLSRAPGESLFSSDPAGPVVGDDNLFNPIVLAAVELPTGQRYDFGYNICGEIESVRHPTGGEERFEFGAVDSVVELNGPGAALNRGVRKRTVNVATEGAVKYVWRYGATAVSDSTLRTVTSNPDGSRVERLFHRGRSGSSEANFGFHSALAGREFEEAIYTSANRLISKRSTAWERSASPLEGITTSAATAERNPRAVLVETELRGLTGGLSMTTLNEYVNESKLSDPTMPLLTRKVSEFGFAPVGTPRPERPFISTENTFLIDDPSVESTKRAGYRDQNLVSLVSARTVFDHEGKIVSSLFVAFDESGSSSGARGNPTTIRIWDSSKGSTEDPSAYAVTRSEFDAFGNSVKSSGSDGRTTTTEFDDRHHLYPIRIMRLESKAGGSETSSVTEARYDMTTGLKTELREANGTETRFDYDPITLRIVGSTDYVNGNPRGSASQTTYVDEPLLNSIKTRRQIGPDLWDETVSFIDGLGQVNRTEHVSAEGTLIVERQYDYDGRLRSQSEPYRNGEKIRWTTWEYDETGQLIATVYPNGSRVVTVRGVIMGDLAGLAAADLERITREFVRARDAGRWPE